MSTTEWQEIIGTIGAFLLVGGLVLVSIWQFGATWRAKAVLARESQYRTIADKGVVLQESTERQLAEISGRLAEMQTRLHALERILKDVE